MEWDLYSGMEKHINYKLLVLFHVLSHSRACLASCLDICQKNFYESVFHKLPWNSHSMGSLTLGQTNVVLIQHGQGKLLHKVDLCDSTRKLLHKSPLQPVSPVEFCQLWVFHWTCNHDLNSLQQIRKSSKQGNCFNIPKVAAHRVRTKDICGSLNMPNSTHTNVSVASRWNRRPLSVPFPNDKTLSSLPFHFL